ncbi:MULTISPECIES: DoxX family protein [Microbacterium]|uniref:Putative oxidoreductase CatD n=1 Tax=Microbacterium azadirachtae TaxID=582680 RepID=A0A0F0LQM5_9MICO|nr:MULTISPECIES: DoxX family protein [Microbacterium]KJL34575.1 putative oxidoreductase CatD [Microbacterium azadirachtae]PRB05051.1 DoxX family protein [Microbacterium sp. MYb64]
MTNTTKPAASLGLLVLRLVMGGVFAAHGAQKVFEFTLPGTVQAFAGMGAPLPEIAGPVIAFLELIGGILLIAGLFTRPVGVLLAADMVGAIVLVHLGNGIWVGDGGWEFAAVLGAGALALAFTGAGRYGLDRAVLRGPVRALA